MRLLAAVSLMSTALLLGTACADARPEVADDLRKWHSATLDFAGPTVHQADANPNPFLDYRLQVEFTAPSGERLNIAGFFDGDGQGGPAGNVWRVRFNPTEAGRWSYRVSFRRGDDVAISLDPQAGEALAPDGLTGHLDVAQSDADAEGFHRHGHLRYTGGHYLQFTDGSYYLKGGTDSPENFLAYAGFANTRPGLFGIHEYAAHVQDWRPGDPDWGDGQGRGIIGALNYLSSQRVNSLYALLMNIGGDGQDVWPYAGEIDGAGSGDNDNLRFDLAKLRQWETVFSHAQRKGILLHLLFNEAEEPNKRELDDGELGPERKLLYREMAARFGHHNALYWNLSEEYDLDFDLGVDRVREFAAYLDAVDGYHNPITVHNWRNAVQSLSPFFGYEHIHLTSVQHHPGMPYGELVETLRLMTREAGRPLPVAVDEFDRLGKIDGESRGERWPYLSGWARLRKGVLWPILLSGGQVEYILDDLLETDDFRPYEPMWQYTWFARKFMEENLPFWEMEPADELLSDASDLYEGGQVFALPGRVYAVYLPSAQPVGRLDLSQAAGEYELRWYNPRSGEFQGERVTLTGGGPVALPTPLMDADQDWAILIRHRDYELPPVVTMR
jgi:hypothetical protein